LREISFEQGDHYDARFTGKRKQARVYKGWITGCLVERACLYRLVPRLERILWLGEGIVLFSGFTL